MNTKIRHGGRKNGGVPKRTLVTIEDNGTIFFGISRCCKKDTFSKKMGNLIAWNRAKTSLKEPDYYERTGVPQNMYMDKIWLHESGLRGQVGTEDVVSLLKYFDNLDKRIHRVLNS